MLLLATQRCKEVPVRSCLHVHLCLDRTRCCCACLVSCLHPPDLQTVLEICALFSHVQVSMARIFVHSILRGCTCVSPQESAPACNCFDVRLNGVHKLSMASQLTFGCSFSHGGPQCWGNSTATQSGRLPLLGLSPFLNTISLTVPQAPL